jgi:hypothetical protein
MEDGEKRKMSETNMVQ